jgi:type I site-specific restriction endonuclease
LAIGKTIVFAKNHAHAEFIADRFNANYPHYKGEFARVIDFTVEYAQSLIDTFSHPDKAPHIAIVLRLRNGSRTETPAGGEVRQPGGVDNP